MTKLPGLTGKELIAVLAKTGFQVLRIEEVTIFSVTRMGDQPWCPSIRVKPSVQDCFCEFSVIVI